MPRVFTQAQSGKIRRVRGRFGGDRPSRVRDNRELRKFDDDSFHDFAEGEPNRRIDGGLPFDDHYDFDCSDFYDDGYDDLEPAGSLGQSFDAHDEPRCITKLSMAQLHPDHVSIRCLTGKLGFRAKAAPAALLAQPVAYVQSFYGDEEDED